MGKGFRVYGLGLGVDKHLGIRGSGCWGFSGSRCLLMLFLRWQWGPQTGNPKNLVGL